MALEKPKSRQRGIRDVHGGNHMIKNEEGGLNPPKSPLRFFPWLLVIYNFSFFAPVMAEDGITLPNNSGAAVFLALLTDPENLGYIPLLPNAALWAGAVTLLLRKWILARICGFVGLSAAILIGIILWNDRFSFDIGYYAWVASMAFLVIASLLKSR
jgi:hypothetical protein